MAPSLKYAGDPKRPTDVKKYSPLDYTPEDFPPDGFVLLALTFGLAAMMFKFKWAVMIALCALIVSISNSRGTENDIKQIVSAVCVIGFAALQIYFDLPGNRPPSRN